MGVLNFQKIELSRQFVGLWCEHCVECTLYVIIASMSEHFVAYSISAITAKRLHCFIFYERVGDCD